MKTIKEFLTINETNFCGPNDICYVVVNHKGERCCDYIPYTGFGEGDELKKKAENMAAMLNKDANGEFKVLKMKFKDVQYTKGELS